MKKTIWLPLLALALALGACQEAPPTGPEPGADGIGENRAPDHAAAGNRFIVTLREGSRPDEVARDHGVRPDFVYERVVNGFAGSIAQAAREGLMRDHRVARVERDATVWTTGDVTTQSGATWGLDRVDQRDDALDEAYRYSFTGSGVTAYIVDTGIRYTHEEFEGRARSGFDVLREDGSDCHGHGTHVAGTVGGATYGVAKGIDLVSVRVLQCSGAGTISGVIAGLDWIGDNAELPAVANLSLGATASESLDDAVANLVQKGVTMVVAAGNSDADACGYSPARSSAAITIGSVGTSDERSTFSNDGSCLDLFAPGERIASAYHTDDDDAVYMSGTSMAAPHVAGAAALYLEEAGGASPGDVAEALRRRATAGAVAGATADNNDLLYTLSGTDSDEGGERDGDIDDQDGAPIAVFSYACEELTCTFTDESEGGGSIEERVWSLGDGSSSPGMQVTHTYTSEGTYEVGLTVTDGDGRSDSSSENVTVEAPDPYEPAGIALMLDGYKNKGRHQVDLEWGGAEGELVTILLNGDVLERTQNDGAYSHATDNRGKASYTFQVCEVERDRCSEARSLDF